MTTLTGSFSFAEIHGSRVRRRRPTQGTASTAIEATARHTGSQIYTAVAESAMARPAVWQQAAGLLDVLKRPAVPTRNAAQELAEERLNAITHGLGLVISMVATAYLLGMVTADGSTLQVAGCGIYGLTLMLMYAASTLLHAARDARQKLRFQVCDHVAIYLLIAGTYTPFLLALGNLGLMLLGCVWALAAIGISIKIRYCDRLEETSPLPYVGLGWLVVAALKPLLTVVPAGGMALLVAGGLAYSLGVMFYCRDDKRYFHAIWHLFVIAGTACHFCAVLWYAV